MGEIIDYDDLDEIVYEDLEKIEVAACRELCEDIERDEGSICMTNLSRLQQMQLAYAVLKRMKAGADGVKLSNELNKPFRSMGSITLEGKMLEFVNPKLFTFVAGLANNTEVYPLLKNGVRLTFTFHDLTFPVE